jgi:hypothetical protein
MKWSTIWLIWLALTFGSFGVLEGLAFATNKVDTLSETTWSWLHVIPGQDIYQWTLPHLLAIAVLLLLSVILVFHLGFGLFR